MRGGRGSDGGEKWGEISLIPMQRTPEQACAPPAPTLGTTDAARPLGWAPLAAGPAGELAAGMHT
eukprot:1144939-Pelagomonas_calceolata.AAC.5